MPGSNKSHVTLSIDDQATVYALLWQLRDAHHRLPLPARTQSQLKTLVLGLFSALNMSDEAMQQARPLYHAERKYQ